MKLTEKSLEVLDYVKAHGGRVNITDICEATGRNARSIGANVNDLCSEKKGLAMREKVAVDGQEKPDTFVVLTDAGMSFVQPADDAE